MDAAESQALDVRIDALEAELWQLKRQRAQHTEPSPKALKGIRVLDLSRFIFGPFCTQMLADMGADIIKVEPIGIGDPARLAGIVSVNGVSTSFLARNRNKRSICLDLRKPAGQEIALRLVDRCDVLIHNFRPDVMPRLGLDPNRVRERNPGMIYCSLSGYGQTGPRADWPGQDLLVQAMSGIISTTGWDDGPPVAVGAYMADVAGALTAAYGVLTALYARSQYGIGQEIEVSLLDSMIAFQAMETVSFLNSNILPRKSGSGHGCCRNRMASITPKTRIWRSMRTRTTGGGAYVAPRPLRISAPTHAWPRRRVAWNIAPSSPRPCKRFYAPNPRRVAGIPRPIRCAMRPGLRLPGAVRRPAGPSQPDGSRAGASQGGPGQGDWHPGEILRDSRRGRPRRPTVGRAYRGDLALAGI